MTFARAIIIVWMTSQFVLEQGTLARAAVLTGGWLAWRYLTTDPLTAAIDRALNAYAKRWKGQ